MARNGRKFSGRWLQRLSAKAAFCCCPLHKFRAHWTGAQIARHNRVSLSSVCLCAEHGEAKYREWAEQKADDSPTGNVAAFVAGYDAAHNTASEPEQYPRHAENLWLVAGLVQ